MPAFQEIIICEKATQAKLFVKMLGLKQTKVINGKPVAYYDREGGIVAIPQSGHILEQCSPEFYEPSLRKPEPGKPEYKGWNVECLPVIPGINDWRVKAKFDKSGKSKAILAAFKWAMVEMGKPGELTLAVDNDMEGELLGWEVIAHFKLLDHPNISRMLYSALNLSAIKKAYANKDPGSKWFNRYQAGLARACCDWLVGMNVTVALSVINAAFIPKFYALHSGRVIYAICHIIALRHELIKNYTPQKYYSEKVTFKTEQGEVYIGTVKYPEKYIDTELGKMKDLSIAKRVNAYMLKTGQGKITLYEKSEKKTGAPIGFDRTAFDRYMIKKHSMSLDRIANALQVLYGEKALVTYPRVEVKNLDDGMHEVMPNYIAAMANNLSSATQLTDPEKTLYAKAFQMTDPAKKSKIWKAGIADGESHHAIIPTDEKRSLTDLTPDEFIVYRELCDRLIVQFLPDYEYSNTTVITDVGGVPCRTSGNTPRRMGWKALSKEEKEESDEDEDAGVLPPMELGQTNAVAKSETKESTTTEPKHYTEDELLGDLEKPNKFVNNKKVLKRIKKLQIGTGGTRQNHINQLLIKEFVSHVKEKKGRKTIIRLVPTQKLLGLSSISPDYFKHPETSAFWEEAFIKIQKGEQTYAEFMDVQTKLLKRFFLELNDGAFRLTEPILANYKRCEDPCGGYIFLKKLPKKKFDLWCCSKCDAAYIDEKGQLGTKLGSGGGSGQKKGPDKDAKRANCPGCKKKDKAYFKDMPGKSWDLWECEACKKSFFDTKGVPGKQFGASKGKKKK